MTPAPEDPPKPMQIRPGANVVVGTMDNFENTVILPQSQTDTTVTRCSETNDPNYQTLAAVGADAFGKDKKPSQFAMERN